MSNKTEIIIDGNNKGAITAINGVKQGVENLGNVVNGPLSSAMSSFGKFLPITAIATMGYKLYDMTKQAIDSADQIYNMAQKVGMSTEALSTLKYAAELSDLSLDQMQGSLKKLSTNLFDVAHGSGKDAQSAFFDLGINVVDFNGKARQSEDVLLDVADRFAQMTDGTEKSALSIKLFGRAGLDMIPFLNQGKAGISELTNEAKKLGLEISEETGEAADRFNDTLSKWGLTIKGLVNEALPVLLEDLNGFTDGVIELNSAVENFSGESLIQGLSRTVGNFQTWGIDLKQITGIEKLVNDEYERRKKLSEDFGNNLKGIIDQNKVLYEKIYGINKEEDQHLKTVKAIKDEYAKLIEVQAKGQPDYSASGAGVTDQFKPDNSFGPFEMMPVENPFDTITEQSISFFDMYDERAQLMRQNTSDIFGNMGNAANMFFQAGGARAKSMFAIYKAMAIGQAIVSTYSAAAAALAPPPVGAGPLLGPILAASTIALGLAQVASIAGASMGSSGGGGARSSAGGVSSVGSQSVNNNSGAGDYNKPQSVTVNVVFTGGIIGNAGSIARELVPHINNAISDGVN